MQEAGRGPGGLPLRSTAERPVRSFEAEAGAVPYGSLLHPADAVLPPEAAFDTKGGLPEPGPPEFISPDFSKRVPQEGGPLPRDARCVPQEVSI
ncbi:hypothetical protein B2K_31765 [Paenibacillus mucilaginosus K02]|uniref:Uncharacterized protein n=1 Tax=Paenibacillus mucilaginosus K02 TaxID=997761 RepID=I0BS81_9BACL|nr:hypothetical protein B2K_31765 [Paenibacillus mucilaginosus K02]